jgi:uncharacterized protein YjdB
LSIKEIISNNFNININKEDISPPSFVTKELISNSFSININKLEDIPPTVVEKEVISNSFNININKTSIPIDIPVESVSVNPNLKDMFVGDTFQIGYTITPSNATNKDVVFSSNNRSVATVNANTGVVEAKGVGECNITCTTVDGNKSDICNVTVREKAPEKIPVQSVTIAPKQLNLTVGEFHTFSYTIVPENATNKSVVFVSDNTEIATINGNTVTAVTEGSCKVYVRTLDGNKEDVCDLTVISNETEGENTPPILGVVLVSSERPDGSYVLNYNVIDKDQDEITHKLKIDNSEFTTINPNQDGIYCTYNGTGLTAGEHTGYIQISDGENTVTSKKFIINIPIETESIKEQLKLAKDNYDIKHDNLKNVINSIIEDRVFDEEAEGYILDNAFNEYNIALAKYREISQKAIDSIANKKSHDLKDKFNKDIIDINFAVNGLENTMNGAFKDGILTESEKLSIKQHLLILSSEKSDIDKQYETMFANEHLEGQPKTDLSTAYNSYVLAYNSLVTVINNILEKEGLIDSTDRNKLNNAFKEHDSKLGLYSTNATNALDAIAKKKAEIESEKVDKKYAEIILDPETGIKSMVGHLTQKIDGEGGIEQRLQTAEQTITSEGITNIVKDTQFIKDINGKITNNTSLIQQNANQISNKVSNGEFESYKTQTANQIASKVGSDNLGSLLEQNPTSIQIGFNKINDAVVIDKDKMQFKDSAGNQSLSFMRGSLYVYEPNSSVFMGAGVIPRWNSGSYNAGFGVLAGSNSYYYSIARANSWEADTQANPGAIDEYFIINYRDRGSDLSQKQGCHTYYKLYTSGGINGMGYDIENFANIKCLDLYAGTIKDTNGSTILTTNGSSIASNKSWNFNYYTLSNVHLSNASLNTSQDCSVGSISTYTYKGSNGTTLFTSASTCSNRVGWAWNNNNLLDPVIIGGSYGYSITPNTDTYSNVKTCNGDVNLDGILDKINIYPAQSTYKTNFERSLEIDVTELRESENADMFIKRHDTVNSETGESEIVENIDMKSMLHLALLEIKNLKEEVKVLKQKVNV